MACALGFGIAATLFWNRNESLTKIHFAWNFIMKVVALAQVNYVVDHILSFLFSLNLIQLPFISFGVRLRGHIPLRTRRIFFLNISVPCQLIRSSMNAGAPKVAAEVSVQSRTSTAVSCTMCACEPKKGTGCMVWPD